VWEGIRGGGACEGRPARSWRPPVAPSPTFPPLQLPQVLPVAEESNVTLAIHPDDPPIPVLRGRPQILYTVDAIEKVTKLVPSPANGVCFCKVGWPRGPCLSVSQNCFSNMMGRGRALLGCHASIPGVHALGLLHDACTRVPSRRPLPRSRRCPGRGAAPSPPPAQYPLPPSTHLPSNLVVLVVTASPLVWHPWCC
jgi:hypothetical protein